MSKKPLKRIIILGSAIEAWIPAALLSARLPSDDYQISLFDTSDIDKWADKKIANSQMLSHTVLARPASLRLHHILQISERDLGQYARARPALCAAITTDNAAPILLPFGQYGIDRDGTEFQHLWLRNKYENSDQPISDAPINDYNLAIAMHEAQIFAQNGPPALPKYDYGYILDQNSYANLLKKCAAKVQPIMAKDLEIIISNNQITSINMGGDTHVADLYIDASYDGFLRRKIDDSAMAWSGNCLALINGFDEWDHQTGMRFHRLQMAMERLINLWPDVDFAASEINEYNRLTHAETAHIHDMNQLLRMAAGLNSKNDNISSALQRKISVFESRGRIAMEDYEIYSKSEWMAALMAYNIIPKSYDRMALRIDKNILYQWMTELHGLIKNMTKQAAARQSA